MLRNQKFLTTLAAAATLTWGCRDVSEPSGTARATNDPSMAGSRANRETLDEEFARMARENPGFGGLFYDKAGVLTAYMKDAADGRRMAGVKLAADAYLRRRGHSPAALQVRPAQYDFQELKRWHDLLSPVVFTHAEVITLDIKEDRNQVVVGALKDGVRGPILRKAAALGVPRGAVAVEKVAPVRHAATLRDAIRPTVGGIQIRGEGKGNCTLGFNVLTASGINGFVTASHCTTVLGGVDNTLFRQPGTGGTVGVEVIDPRFGKWRTDCPSRLCRESDAALVRYSSGVTFARGYIARTVTLNQGSINIHTFNPRFTLSATQSHQTLGQWVNKVGQTTGWTRGQVNATCYQGRAPGTTNRYLLCQYGVTANAAGGDSGAPVFWEYAYNKWALVGVLWGVTTTPTGQPSYQYSSWAGVDFEIGSETGGFMRIIP
jgi:hypothetical protein